MFFMRRAADARPAEQAALWFDPEIARAILDSEARCQLFSWAMSESRPTDLSTFAPAIDTLQERAELAAERGAFTGGPVERYVTAGRLQFEVLRNAGVQPHHRVVDIGAGALRLGYWLMNYLEPGNYFALEPSRQMIETGIGIVGQELLDRARPKINDNDQFDLSSFGPCDFGIARSVWTHTSMHQIDLLLASWAAYGSGPLFCSFLPARGRRDAYHGDEWVGISHESAEPGLVRHRLGDIRSHAKLHGLTVEEVDEAVLGNQVWLQVKGASRT